MGIKKLLCMLTGLLIVGIIVLCLVEKREPIMGETLEVNNYIALENEYNINYIAEELLSDAEICIYINNFATVINLNDDTTVYDTTQMMTEYSNEFYVQDSKGYKISIDGKEIKDYRVFQLDVETLDSNNTIEIKFEKDGQEQKFEINTLHSKVNVTSEGTNSDEVYYYFDYNDAAVKTDKAGNILFYKHTDFIRDFRRIELDDGIYYAYLERANKEDYDNVSVEGCAHMRLIVLDESYVAVDRVDYLLTDNGIMENHSIENHEYEIFAVGHYIVTSYVALEVDNVPSNLSELGESLVAAAVFQEIKDGELIFEFNSTNYPEFYNYSTDTTRNNFESEEYQDYMHMNSVIIDPEDGNYIVSMRGLDSIIKIDKTTSEILWNLGGLGDDFSISEEQQFSRQHFARLTMNNTLTIFDNGRDAEQSRLLEFELDEENKVILNCNIFEIDGYYGSIRGSTLRVDAEQDIFLSSWGWTQENNAIITEYNFTTDEKIIEFYDHTGGECRNYRINRFNK